MADPREPSKIATPDEALHNLVLASRVNPTLRGWVRVVEDEIERLRWALLFWNHSHNPSELRDRLADVISRNPHGIDQPYRLADDVLSVVNRWMDEVDQTLYDLIPEDEWGISLEQPPSPSCTEPTEENNG